MALENSASDNARGNALDSSPVWGYILDGLIDVDNLKMSFEKVIQHFPILSALMDLSATAIVLPTQEVELFSWTVVHHDKALSAVFTEPPKTDVISVTPIDTRARADFYVPMATTVVRRPGVADQKTPLIEVRVQLFTDKTVIGLSWNHLLTDGSGMAIVVSSWTKALRGEALPDPAPYSDPFKAHYSKTPTAPLGSVIPGFSKKVGIYSRAITEIIRYGPPESRLVDQYSFPIQCCVNGKPKATECPQTISSQHGYSKRGHQQ